MKQDIKIDYDSLIQRYTSGELSANELRNLQASIASSAEASRLFRSALELRSMLRDDLLSIEVPEDWTEDVRSQVEELFAQEKERPILLPVVPVTDMNVETEAGANNIAHQSAGSGLFSGFGGNKFLFLNRNLSKYANNNANVKINSKKFVSVVAVVLALFISNSIAPEFWKKNKIERNTLANLSSEQQQLQGRDLALNSEYKKNIMPEKRDVNNFSAETKEPTNGLNTTVSGKEENINKIFGNKSKTLNGINKVKPSSFVKQIGSVTKNNLLANKNNLLADKNKNSPLAHNPLEVPNYLTSKEISKNIYNNVSPNNADSSSLINSGSSSNINTREQAIAILAKTGNMTNLEFGTNFANSDNKHFSIGLNLSPSEMSNVNSYYISMNISDNDRIGIEIGGIVATSPANTKSFSTDGNFNKRRTDNSVTVVNNISPAFGKMVTDINIDESPDAISVSEYRSNDLGKRATGDYSDSDILYSGFSAATKTEFEVVFTAPLLNNNQTANSVLQTYGAIFYDRKFKFYNFVDVCSRVAVGGTDNAVLGNAKIYLAANINKNLTFTLGAYGVYTHTFSKMMTTPSSGKGLFGGVETGF